MEKAHHTACTYMEWDQAMLFIMKLEQEKKYSLMMCVAIGVYTGMRISDMLKLRWRDIYGVDEVILREKKTKKVRKVFLSDRLKVIIKRVFEDLEVIDFSQHVICRSPRPGKKPMRNKAWSYDTVRRQLIFNSYYLGIKMASKNGTFGTHSLRKTFGRRVWELEGADERALVLLMDIFNHSSLSITKRYLGIRIEEIEHIYKNL